MTAIWNRLHAALSAKAPRLLNGLNPPATAHEVEMAERVLGTPLPDNCRAAYLVHDGCRDENRAGNPPRPFFVGISANWNCLSGLVVAAERRQSVSQGARDDWAARPEFEFSSEGLKIRQDWWNARAIPIGSTWSGEELLVDLEPGQREKQGSLSSFRTSPLDLRILA